MNERIKLLVKQAGINIVPRRPYIDEEPDGYLESDNDFVLNNYEVAVALLEGEALEKFAELVWKAAYEEGHDVGVDAGFEAGRNASFTEKHFGVEE